MRTSRRIFLGAVGGSLALSACKRGGGGETQSSSSEVPKGPPPSAPKEHDIELTPETIGKRKLGRTGEQVSMIGLGGFHIGVPASEQESIRIIRYAVDHGVTFMDNCWDYNEGKSEERMGKALRDGYRQKVFLMTKIDGRTEKSASEQLDQSLKRLQTDVIDLVQIHEIIRNDDPERCFAEGGTMAALHAAKKAGKLRYIGFTGHKDPAIHVSMLRAGLQRGFTFDTVQMPLNVMDPHFRSFEKNVLPLLVQHDIGVLGMKPLGSGEILKSGVVNATECLHYALSLPASVVITGCDSMGVLKQAIRAAQTFTPLSAEQAQALLARTAPHAKQGKHEQFKVSQRFDGTEKNRHWLDTARL